MEIPVPGFETPLKTVVFDEMASDQLISVSGICGHLFLYKVAGKNDVYVRIV